MWFKNLIFYRLTETFALTEEQLQQKLSENRFTGCKSQELSRYGWTEPCSQLMDQLVYTAQGFMMISARKEEKIIPTSVIKQAVAEKVDQIEQQQARKVYKKEKDQLKDEVILDLLPRAFSRFQQTSAIISPQQGWIAVDSSNHKKAEELLSYLRGTLGSLPITLPDVNHSPAAIMTHWLENQNELDSQLEILDECELRDNVLEGGVIKIKGQQLEDEEFLAHIEAGKQVTKLLLCWDEQLKFVLNDDLSIKRLKLSDQLQEQMNQEDHEDEVSQFATEMVQMGLEFNRLFPTLIKLFGGEAQRP